MGDVLTFVPRATFVEEIRKGLITKNIRAALFAERKDLIESRPHSWDLKFVCSILELPNPSEKRMSAKQISQLERILGHWKYKHEKRFKPKRDAGEYTDNVVWL
jgi:hypothetical protein